MIMPPLGKPTEFRREVLHLNFTVTLSQAYGSWHAKMMAHRRFANEGRPSLAIEFSHSSLREILAIIPSFSMENAIVAFYEGPTHDKDRDIIHALLGLVEDVKRECKDELEAEYRAKFSEEEDIA